MNGNLSGHYALGTDIDASATSGWNAGAGFLPVGIFGGVFEGLGHTISNLTIDRPATNFVGLFGQLSGASARIADVGTLGRLGHRQPQGRRAGGG